MVLALQASKLERLVNVYRLSSLGSHVTFFLNNLEDTKLIHIFAFECLVKRMYMAREERNLIGYTVALISEFALHYGIQPRQAYAYLKRFKGMEHLRNHYNVLHTQSFPDTVEILTQVCLHNGGGLR